MAGRLYKRKDGYWYYKYSFINEFGFVKYRMVSCKTKDDETASKVKVRYDKTFGDLTNPLSNPQYTYPMISEDYMKIRARKVKRGELSHNTLSGDKNAVIIFGRWLEKRNGTKDVQLFDINHKEIQKYIDDRLDDVSPTTANNNVKHLSSFFSWCVKKDYIKKNPCLNTKLEKPKPRKRTNIPEREDWAILWEHIESKVQRWLDGEEKYDYFSTIIWIQMNLGMRIGEVCGMKWKQGSNDYDTGHSNSYIYLSNDMKKLTIYFKRRLREIPTHSIINVLEKIPQNYKVRRWVNTSRRRKAVKMKYVFGNPYTNNERYTNQISRDFKKLMRKLRLSEKLTTHSLRHGWAVNQIRNNSNIYTISKFMGHSVVQVTEIYANHLRSDDFDEIVMNNKPKET